MQSVNSLKTLCLKTVNDIINNMPTELQDDIIDFAEDSLQRKIREDVILSISDKLEISVPIIMRQYLSKNSLASIPAEISTKHGLDALVCKIAYECALAASDILHDVDSAIAFNASQSDRDSDDEVEYDYGSSDTSTSSYLSDDDDRN